MLSVLDGPPRAYAGIGSRTTPEDVLELMGKIAWYLSFAGWTLRTGGADGADTAFQTHALLAADSSTHTPSSGSTELYLPWSGFGDWGHLERTRPSLKGRLKVYAEPTPEAFALSRDFHPIGPGGWDTFLSSAVKKLMARNAHQALGRELDDPSAFVLCWTPDGVTLTTTRQTGGTGQAIRIANGNGIPVFNLQREDHRSWWENWVKHNG